MTHTVTCNLRKSTACLCSSTFHNCVVPQRTTTDWYTGMPFWSTSISGPGVEISVDWDRKRDIGNLGVGCRCEQRRRNSSHRMDINSDCNRELASGSFVYKESFRCCITTMSSTARSGRKGGERERRMHNSFAALPWNSQLPVDTNSIIPSQSSTKFQLLHSYKQGTGP